MDEDDVRRQVEEAVEEERRKWEKVVASQNQAEEATSKQVAHLTAQVIEPLCMLIVVLFTLTVAPLVVAALTLLVPGAAAGDQRAAERTCGEGGAGSGRAY